jgi:osmotically-inducible protein OsmY
MSINHLPRRGLAVSLAITITTLNLLLSGCGPIVVGGVAAGAALIATDRRTSGIQLEDQNIALKIEHSMSQHLGESARIKADAYEGQVLLTGEAPTEKLKAQAALLAKSVEHVKTVHNCISLGPIASLKTRSTDAWITSKVRGTLLNTRHVPSGTIAIRTAHSVVYLQGKVTQTEGAYAARAAAGINGVTQVVKLFEIISRAEALRLSNMETTAPQTPSTGENTSDAGGQSNNTINQNVQAIPVR